MEKSIFSDSEKAAVKALLSDYCDKHLTPVQGKKHNYICPFCGSGTGKNGTAAFSIDPKTNFTTWKCFSAKCPSQGGDIFALIRQMNNCTYRKAEEIAAADLHVNISKKTAVMPKQNQIQQQRELPDYTALFLQAQQDIEKTDYWQKRGFSLETIKRGGVGFIEKWKSKRAPKNAKAKPVMIFPAGKHGYGTRYTGPEELLNDDERRYIKQDEGKMQLYMQDVLKDVSGPVFVTEGPFDALSIMEAGGDAVALFGAGNDSHLLTALKQCAYSGPLILALDNDEPGQKAAGRLEEQLLKAGYVFINAADKINDGQKDPNEALLDNRQLFTENVQAAIAAAQKEALREKAKEEIAANKQEESKYYVPPVSSYIGELFLSWQQARADKVWPTGFKQLDNLLDGGLTAGRLYILGAMPATGKTAFALQMADQIADKKSGPGLPVLYFALEMGRDQMVERSVVREGFFLVPEGQRDKKALDAKLFRKVWRGEETKSDDVFKYTVDAFNLYANNKAENMFIKDVSARFGIEEIKETVDLFCSKYPARPAVFIDYLQIISPDQAANSDKQNIDTSITQLKALAVDYQVPVFLISSLNRNAYFAAGGVGMKAFKESGGIEYGADVLIGMQIKGATTETELTEKQKQPKREIELKILKNREGDTSEWPVYDYYANYHAFKEKE